MFAKLQQKCYVIDFFPDIREKHAIVAVGLVYVIVCVFALCRLQAQDKNLQIGDKF